MKRHEYTDRVTHIILNKLRQHQVMTWYWSTCRTSCFPWRDRAGAASSGVLGWWPVWRHPRSRAVSKEGAQRPRGTIETQGNRYENTTGWGIMSSKSKKQYQTEHVRTFMTTSRYIMLNRRYWKDWWWHFVNLMLELCLLSKKSGKKWETNIFCCKAKTRTQTDVKEEMVNEFPKDAGGAD